MLRIKDVQTIHGERVNHEIISTDEHTTDASGLTLLPALIDPHVHFRVPGGEHKEDWRTGAAAAIAGGITTVLDMPNNIPACTTKERLEEKKNLIDEQLKEAAIPLRYHLYLGAHKDSLGEIERAQGAYVGIKVFLGQSTGTLLMDSDEAFAEVCRIAADIGALVAVHAEDDHIIEYNKQQFPGIDVSLHSRIRAREAAITALQKALSMAKKYGTHMYILHASTKEEVDMIRKAKQDGLNIFLETTPHHLFLSEKDYERLGTLGQMNPPLRTEEDQAALWQGLLDGTIDTIGTDHAPHTKEEKNKPYGEAPSGVPGIETLLPLLLNEHNKGKISLETIIQVTRTNAEKIFRLEPNDDVVLVDLSQEKIVDEKNLKTKCGWSPFAGWKLKGWPVYTILREKLYKV